jgi:ATP-dependent RNA helicase DDX46/PRP5
MAAIRDFTPLDPFFAAATSVTTAKPAGALNRNALTGLGLKGLPVKSDVLKSNSAVASMDDSNETKREIETLGDMPAVDMTMVDGEGAVGDLEGDEDDEEANRMEAAMKSKVKDIMDVDEDEQDPLDAFMTGIKQEVKKVNEEDLKKMGLGQGQSRVRLDDGTEDAMDDLAEAIPDELDQTELNPEDILALAAKKAKKKDLATVDHSRVAYESFRKEFYSAPPDIAAMTDEEAELVRLELDSIKIRGVDCPRPVTKWSHFGLPASW